MEECRNCKSEVKKGIGRCPYCGILNPTIKVKLKNKGLVVLGNNYSPTGRYLNRRIMVLLYIEH